MLSSRPVTFRAAIAVLAGTRYPMMLKPAGSRCPEHRIAGVIARTSRARRRPALSVMVRLPRFTSHVASQLSVAVRSDAFRKLMALLIDAKRIVVEHDDGRSPVVAYLALPQ